MLKASAQNHINSVIRIRPFFNNEKRQPYLDVLNKTIIVPILYRTKKYKFDKVLTADVDQSTVFDAVLPILDDVVTGFSCSVITYGAAGTGKTYTQFGCPEGSTSLEEGIVHRSLEYFLSQCQENRIYGIQIWYYLILGDSILDLVANDTPFRIRQDQKTKSIAQKLQGLKGTYFATKQQISEILSVAAERKKDLLGVFDAQDQDAHVIMKIETYCENQNSVTTGKLMLIDLASTMKTTSMFQDSIDASLQHLDLVCQKLSEKCDHIPFNDSVLTRVMKPCLDGTSKTTVIGTISPNIINKQETLATLDFMFRLSNITFDVQPLALSGKDEVLTKSLELLNQQMQELKQARTNVLQNPENLGFFVNSECYEAITSSVANKEPLSDIEKQIAHFYSRIAEVEDKCKIMEASNAKISKIRDETVNGIRKADDDLKKYQQTLLELQNKSKELEQDQNLLGLNEKELVKNFKKCSEIKTNLQKNREELENQLSDMLAMKKRYEPKINEIQEHCRTHFSDLNMKYLKEFTTRKVLFTNLLNRQKTLLAYWKSCIANSLINYERCFNAIFRNLKESQSEHILEMALKDKHNQQLHSDLISTLKENFTAHSSLLNVMNDKLKSQKEQNAKCFALLPDLTKQFQLFCAQEKLRFDQQFARCNENNEMESLIKTCDMFALDLRSLQKLNAQQITFNNNCEEMLINYVNEHFDDDAFDSEKLCEIISASSSNVVLERVNCAVDFSASFNEISENIQTNFLESCSTLNSVENQQSYGWQHLLAGLLQEVISEVTNSGKDELRWLDSAISSLDSQTMDVANGITGVVEKCSLIIDNLKVTLEETTVAENIDNFSGKIHEIVDIYKNNCFQSTGTVIKMVKNSNVPQPNGNTPLRSNGISKYRDPEAPKIPETVIQDLSLIQMSGDENSLDLSELELKVDENESVLSSNL